MKLQQLLLDELENSKENSGLTLQGETYDNDLYISMKAFWDLFTGEITHEYTCTSCKITSRNQELINYLLLKFPDAHHACDEDCTVQSLIEYHLQEEDIKDYQCSCCEKNTLAKRKSSITNFPSFLCILLCCSRKDNNGTISSAVEFPVLAFDLKGDHMPYDLSATVHHKPTKGGNGHYTAISRSRNLQSQEWFMYDDDRVSSSKFTKMQKKHTMVKKTI
jgi:ubiquitin C-terminal hydrolase